MILPAILAGVGAYLIGAIPFGLLIGRAFGVDIRQHGSRNIGATNVGRVLGKRWGYLCLALDLLKGLIPAVIAGGVLAISSDSDAVTFGAWLLIAFLAVVGHVFPVYLGFRGGKGVATTIGAGVGVFPYLTVAMAVALLAYALGAYGTGFVSAGSIALAICFPLGFAGYAWFAALPMERFWPFLAATVAIAALILVRHTSNIRRLVSGQELRTSKT